MMADSLRALLANLVDYAGMYPPESLPLAETVSNYERYLRSADGWILNRLVLPAGRLGEAAIRENWRITLLVDREPGPLPPQVETLETKAGKRLSLPTYCEVPLELMEDGYAKVRTGGAAADATPTSEFLAAFLYGAAARRLPFKATAGLHHPIRSTTHGFLNVFVAATFAWLGMDEPAVTRVLNETGPEVFEFRNDGLRWREWRASTAEIAQARRDFAHSFGSCSFEEPLRDLRALGLLK